MATRFCVFDVETLGASADWSSGAWWSDNEQGWTQDRAAFLDALRRQARRRVTLAAHNAEYDLTTCLWRAGEDLTLHFYEGAFIHATWKYGDGARTVPIWDSLRLSGGLGVAELGEKTGLPKYPMPQKLQGHDPDRYAWSCEKHQAGECEECYTLRDCEIVYRHLERLSEYVLAQGVELRRTLPSTAVDFWAALDPDQLQTLRSPELRRLVRPALHGGRCEVFRYGVSGPVFTYDRRRHYGTILATEPMPDLRFLSVEHNLPPDWPLDGKEGVIDATVEQPPLWCPTLPAEDRGLLCYPVGVFRGTWAIVEARRAIQRGARLLAIHRAAWTSRTVMPFLNTAGALLQASIDWEDQGNPLGLVAKQLLNAIPGRLGMQEGGETRMYRRWVPGMAGIEGIGWEPTITSDAVYLHQSREMQHPPATSNLLWAVQIAALGRVKLLDDLELAGKSLIYCDTDSVHSSVPLPVEGNGAGQRHDTGQYDQGHYLAPKLYRLSTYAGNVLVRAKGIRPNAAEEYFEQGRTSYPIFLGIQHALARGAQPGTWVDVERVRHLGLARRQLENPLAMSLPDVSSGTQPLVFGGD